MEWGVSEGLIYNNFEVQEFDYKTILRDRNCFATYGLDFGFTDPTAFVGVIVNQKENILYIFKEWYQTNVTNDDIARALKDLGLKGEKVYCDSAEPKSIAELRKLNINAVAVAKGADSVRYGIQKIQNYKIIIHPECEEFYHEISNYIWKKDRNGNTTNVPEHEFSHCLTGDTLVMTTEGEKPIKELVNKQGNVYCFNEKTKQKTISNFFDCRLTRKNAPLLKITLADGKEIKLTPDHLILTKNGWKKTEDLTLNDEILKI